MNATPVGTPCGHWSDGVGYCGTPTRVRFLPGFRCPDHTPAALAGRPEASPNPDHTMEGLRRTWYAERDLEFVPSSTPVGDTLIDQRAVASGKRRSSPNTYRAAQAATNTSRGGSSWDTREDSTWIDKL